MCYEYFLSDDPFPYLTILTSEQREVATDGRTDQNRQTIAVTLRLRFAVRVNYLMYGRMHPSSPSFLLFHWPSYDPPSSGAYLIASH